MRPPSARLVPRPGAEAPTPIAEPRRQSPSQAEPEEPIDTPTEPVAAPLPAATEADPVTARPAAVELDRETVERRREILELFQSLPLKNHFEVLGVEPGCSDAEVKRAYASLAKRYHPDVNRDARLEDLRDILEAIFIQVGEAWEVLGNARSRASYEARFGVVRRPSDTPPRRRARPRGRSRNRPSLTSRRSRRSTRRSSC